MKCNICGEKIDRWDGCNDKFHKGDVIFCCTDGFDEHKCGECYIPAEEGEVE